MDDSAIVVVLSSAPSSEVAQRLAEQLIETRLAACVHVQPHIQSVYRWKGQVERQSEAQLVIKTQRRLLAALRDFMRQHHPYEVPELLALPVEWTTHEYAAWLGQQLESV